MRHLTSSRLEVVRWNHTRRTETVVHAIVQREFGSADTLILEETTDPVPGPGQVRIRVSAIGVHLVDTTIRAGRDNGTMPVPSLPMTPGREVAGVVDLLGDGVGTALLGARVVAHLGTASGGYAELAVAAAASLHLVPDRVPFEAAVAAIGTSSTTLGILDQRPLTAADTALVTSAAGGIGTLLVQAGRRAGAFVIGVADGPGKVALVREPGADIVVDRHDPRWLEQIAATRPTVVFDGVGGAVGRAAFAALAPGGVQLVFGWSSGEPNTYGSGAKSAVTVLGPRLTARPGGLRSLETEALARVAAGSWRPVVGGRFPLADAAGAHRALESGAAVGKVVLEVAR